MTQICLLKKRKQKYWESMPKGKVRVRVICPLQKEKKMSNKKKKFVIFYCKIYIYCKRRVLFIISYICRKMHEKKL